MNLLLLCCLLAVSATLHAADITIRVEVPAGATVIIVVTNSVPVLATADARKSLPRPIPMPPMPPALATRRGAALLHRPLPGATNHPSYRAYQQHLADSAAHGRRRSE